MKTANGQAKKNNKVVCVDNNLIIISDKDEEFSKELEEMLNDNGYDTLSFTKSEKALKAADKLKPHIMLFDVHINGEFAIKYANKLEHLSKKHKIYIVALAAFCDNSNCQLMKEKTGIKDCLIKPIKPIDILAKIKKIIGVNNEQKSNIDNNQQSTQTF